MFCRESASSPPGDIRFKEVDDITCTVSIISSVIDKLPFSPDLIVTLNV